MFFTAPKYDERSRWCQLQVSLRRDMKTTAIWARWVDIRRVHYLASNLSKGCIPCTSINKYIYQNWDVIHAALGAYKLSLIIHFFNANTSSGCASLRSYIISSWRPLLSHLNSLLGNLGILAEECFRNRLTLLSVWHLRFYMHNIYFKAFILGYTHYFLLILG